MAKITDCEVVLLKTANASQSLYDYLADKEIFNFLVIKILHIDKSNKDTKKLSVTRIFFFK